MSYKVEDPKQHSDGSWYVQYPIKDADGKTISVTTLTGATEKEVWRKIQQAHAEASVAVARLRSRAPVYKPGTFTKDEQEAIAVKEERRKLQEERASLEFCRRHIADYTPSMGNANILSAIMDELNLDWAVDNIETAFAQAMKENRLALPAYKEPEAQPETPEAPETPVIAVPWTTPLTTKAIHDMPREEYSGYLKHRDPKIQTEFKRQLAEIGIFSAGGR